VNLDDLSPVFGCNLLPELGVAAFAKYREDCGSAFARSAAKKARNCSALQALDAIRTASHSVTSQCQRRTAKSTSRFHPSRVSTASEGLASVMDFP
jgi:hypothetical protein